MNLFKPSRTATRIGHTAVLAYVAYNVVMVLVLGPTVGAAWGHVAQETSHAVTVWHHVFQLAGWMS